MKAFLKRAKRFAETFVPELIVVLALIFVINNYIGNVDIRISSDGKGYYDYLPAIFIYHDFPERSHNDSTSNSKRISRMKEYSTVNGMKVNKYPVGTALLISPFFAWAHISAPQMGYEQDGFSFPYQKAVFAAALFYLFAGLLFLKKLLRLYNISAWIIIFIQVLAVFATSLIHYVNYEPAFSHVYSFFAVTAFFFYTRLYFIQNKSRRFLIASALFGLIFLLRPVNIIVLFALPFLAGSFQNLKSGVYSIVKRPEYIVSGVLISFLIMSVQLFLWRYQTSSWIVDTYTDERFHFFQPAFFNILFSYRKGLFVYTPVLLFSFAGLYVLLQKRESYQFISWLSFFLFLTYILSSWQSWYYGCSYGLRAYIDFYSIFFILLATGISGLKRIPAIILLALCLPTIPLNAVQTYQYKEYILHWDGMNREKYWQVFLKTDPRFKGFVWRDKNQIPEKARLLKRIGLGDINFKPEEKSIFFDQPADSISRSGKINAVRVLLTNNFAGKEKAAMMLNIGLPGEEEYLFRHKVSLIHFEKQGFNNLQEGEYVFLTGNGQITGSSCFTLTLYCGEDSLKLEDIKIEFYGVDL